MINTTTGSSHGRFFIPDSYVLEEVQKTLELLLSTSQMLGDYSNRPRRSGKIDIFKLLEEEMISEHQEASPRLHVAQ